MRPNAFRPPVVTINPKAPARLSDAFAQDAEAPEQSSAPTESVSSFPVQSAIDGTIVYQPPGNLIVPGTLIEGQTPGYAAMWSPDADCPMVLVFKASAGGQRVSSKPLIVLPGQLVRPHGLTKEGGRGGFSGYDIGLPYGWLGGGVGRLLVFKTPDAHVAQVSGSPREVLFHQTQLTIADAFTNIPTWPQTPATRTAGGTGGGGASTASQNWNATPWDITGTPQWVGPQGTPVPNWPSRFPWPNAYGSDAASGLAQQPMGGALSGKPGGTPRISVRPTRVVLSLQTVNKPGNMGSGNVIAYVVPPSTQAVPANGVLRKYPQVQYITFPQGDANGLSTVEVDSGPLVSSAGDDAAVGLVSDADASLNGVTVSVFRYGVLG